MIRKCLGLLLIAAAVVGIMGCAAGFVAIWRVKPDATAWASDNLTLVDQTLIATQDGLTAINQMVQTTTADLVSLQNTTQALAQAINDTSPMLESLTSLAAKDLPQAITSTQAALGSAQSSARLIDSVLGALTGIPFLPVAQYAPAVPLATSLGEVSASLDGISPAMATIAASLSANKTNLGGVSDELTNISNSIKGISANLGSAQKSIAQYQAATTKLKDRVEAAQRTAPGLITTLAWVFTLLLAWLLIVQLGLGVQGLELLRGRAG